MHNNYRMLLVSLAALLGAALLSGCGPAPAAKPTGYERWDSKDGTFSIDYPANWEAAGGGKHGIQWAKFTSGGAIVRVDTNLSDSLMTESADVTIDAEMALEMTPEEIEQYKYEMHPINAIHAMRVEDRKAEMSGYTEEKTERIECNLGEARKGKFTASAGIGGKVKGYHVTILGHNKRVTVICKCAESDWEMLQPEFDKMIASLGS